MTSFVKNADIEGPVLVSTVNVDAEITDKPYEPETPAAEKDLLDVANAAGVIVVHDDTPSVFEPAPVEEPEPVVAPVVPETVVADPGKNFDPEKKAAADAHYDETARAAEKSEKVKS